MYDPSEPIDATVPDESVIEHTKGQPREGRGHRKCAFCRQGDDVRRFYALKRNIVNVAIPTISLVCENDDNCQSDREELGRGVSG